MNNREQIYNLIKLETTTIVDDNATFTYHLTEKTYNHEEINAMVEVFLNDKLTMGNNVVSFEKEFAEYIGSKYAIMVNSGSSANLLAMAVLTNFKYANKLNAGDKIIIPTVCWSTSVWPIIQMGLIPVFVDINLETLNSDTSKIEDLLMNDDKIKGIVVVHILGNCTNMKIVMELKQKYNLVIMEDTCESLGSSYNNKRLGTFGECGTYSFYFSHHITTIEGGMVVTDSEEIYELLKCLRAHGWSRGQKSVADNNTRVDNRFCFINIGYNLRPMETQAAMGRVQLKKLNVQNNNRKQNYNKIISKIKNSGSDKLICFKEQTNCDCIWFLLNIKYDKFDYLETLEKHNIETRPIVTGNFTRQPVFQYLNMTCNPDSFIASEIIHNQGFFIGLPAVELSESKINTLVTILLSS